MKREDWIRMYDERHELLDIIGAKSVNRARVKLDNERKGFLETKNQLLTVIEALEVDNWRNAVVRAKSLLDKLEQNQMPKWLRSVSPAWSGKVRPTEYSRMKRLCQEHYLMLLGEWEAMALIDPTFNVEEQERLAEEFYLTNLPGQFVDEVAAYVNADKLEEIEEREQQGEEV
jgi:hypothetical protein